MPHGTAVITVVGHSHCPCIVYWGPCQSIGYEAGICWLSLSHRPYENTNLLTGGQDGLVFSPTDSLMPEHTKSRQILTSGKELAKTVALDT